MNDTYKYVLSTYIENQYRVVFEDESHPMEAKAKSLKILIPTPLADASGGGSSTVTFYISFKVEDQSSNATVDGYFRIVMVD